jgi:N-acetylglucosamine malate deacetylase 2
MVAAPSRPPRLLYVFPHPDDESFGPGAAIARQCRLGYEVSLLVLTRGGATKLRHDLGLSVEEMGAVRTREMKAVAEVYGLTLAVLDFPDGGLKELDPREPEAAVRGHVQTIRPDVIVTHPAHGVSGFEDHLVAHAVVKRVFCALRDEDGHAPRRLAFTTLESIPAGHDGPIRLKTSEPEAIDCVEPATEADLATQRRALACYETYADVIAEVDPASITGRNVPFEIFQEEHDPRLGDLTEGWATVDQTASARG